MVEGPTACSRGGLRCFCTQSAAGARRTLKWLRRGGGTVPACRCSRHSLVLRAAAMASCRMCSVLALLNPGRMEQLLCEHAAILQKCTATWACVGRRSSCRTVGRSSQKAIHLRHVRVEQAEQAPPCKPRWRSAAPRVPAKSAFTDSSAAFGRSDRRAGALLQHEWRRNRCENLLPTYCTMPSLPQ